MKLIWIHFADLNIGGKYKTIDIGNQAELYSIARRLVVEQKHAIDHCFKTRSFAKAKISAPNPIHIIIHGGGGVRKTDVIKAISKRGEKPSELKNKAFISQESC